MDRERRSLVARRRDLPGLPALVRRRRRRRHGRPARHRRAAWTTWPTSASTRCGSRRSTRRRRPTPATTSPTTATSTRCSARWPTSTRCCARPTELGLRVIVDLVPNHTSDEHAWFSAALAAGPGQPERARYLFRDGTRRRTATQPPNNWQSVFGGPAWTRITEPDGTPGQWYLHLFDTQPARPQLGQPRGARRVRRRPAVLARPRRRRVPGRRGARPGQAARPGRLDLPRSRPGRRRHRTGERAADVGPGGRARHLPGVARGPRRLRRPTASWSPRRGCEPPERLARYVRPDEMHQAFNFDYLLAPWQRAGAARADRALARGQRARSARRPPGCCPTTTWCGTRPGSACRAGERRAERHRRRRPAARRGAGPAPGPRGDAADAGAARRRRTSTRARSSACRSTPRCPTRCARTRPGSGRRTPSAGRDGCRVPMPWQSDAPAYGFAPSGASVAAAAGVLRRAGARTGSAASTAPRSRCTGRRCGCGGSAGWARRALTHASTPAPRRARRPQRRHPRARQHRQPTRCRCPPARRRCWPAARWTPTARCRPTRPCGLGSDRRGCDWRA